MKSTLIAAAVVALGLSFWSTRTSIAQQGQLSEKDKQFLMEAASGGMFEVKMGKVAEDQAASPEVKKFGELMVRDHSEANKLLMSLAQSKGVDIPKKMNDNDQNLFEKLSKLNGADFDVQYMKHMVADHVNDLSKFEAIAADGQDPDVRAFANKTIPVLRDHLQRARALTNTLR